MKELDMFKKCNVYILWFHCCLMSLVIRRKLNLGKETCDM